MRKHVVIGVALLGSIAGSTAESQNSPAQPLNVHRVAANVYMIDNGTSDASGGGNIAVLVGNDGLLLVDAQGWDDPAPVLTALRTISDKPVSYVIDTHCHTDHTAGNAAFQRAGATIVAHANVRRRLDAKKCDNQVAPPTLTFDSRLTLHFDDEEVRVIALPTGHTDGDAIVYFKSANVAATGDAFVSSNLPAYSKYAGGDMLGVNVQLRRIVALLPGDVKIIPGHGPESVMRDVRAASTALDGMRDAIAEQIAKGKTLAQLRAMDVLEPWRDLIDGPNRPNYLQSYYDCLTGPPDPRFQL
jgi:cyclase